MALVDDIDALLPQLQCKRCGTEGCRPYADAIVHHNAPINQCAPGGTLTMEALAALLNRVPEPLSKEHLQVSLQPVSFAKIDEATCIGCTLCIQACPVDAIIGTAKKMHTVLKDACTGCELCVPVCPVDCITLIPETPLKPTWIINADESTQTKAQQARVRFQARLQRKNPRPPPLDLKQALADALKRAQEKKGKPIP